MADPLRHRQTKGAATDMVDLTPPRHIPTLPDSNASPSQIPAIAHSQSLVSPGEKLPFVTRAEGAVSRCGAVLPRGTYHQLWKSSENTSATTSKRDGKDEDLSRSGVGRAPAALQGGLP